MKIILVAMLLLVYVLGFLVVNARLDYQQQYLDSILEANQSCGG